MTTKHLAILLFALSGILGALLIYQNRSMSDTYKKEFESLLGKQKKELLDSLHRIEKRITEREKTITRLKGSMNSINDKVNKNHDKINKIPADVGRIADDSLANAFTNEFK